MTWLYFFKVCLICKIQVICKKKLILEFNFKILAKVKLTGKNVVILYISCPFH